MNEGLLALKEYDDTIYQHPVRNKNNKHLSKTNFNRKLATLTTRADYVEGTRHRRIKIRKKVIPEELF